MSRIDQGSSSIGTSRVVPETPPSRSVGVIDITDNSFEEESQTETGFESQNDFQTNFKNEQRSQPRINRLDWSIIPRNVAMAPDIIRQPDVYPQSRFNASSVYEWNLDGMSEYQVLGLLQQMTMAVNAYKTQTGSTDKAIVELLIAGFSGQLKGWWDYHLTPVQQLQILSTIQTFEDGTPFS